VELNKPGNFTGPASVTSAGPKLNKPLVEARLNPEYNPLDVVEAKVTVTVELDSLASVAASDASVVANFSMYPTELFGPKLLCGEVA
jgi:hypothetical protein